MKTTARIFTASAALLLLAANSSAQDSFFDGDSSSGFDSFGGSSSSIPVEFSGTLKADGRAYLDKDVDGKDTGFEAKNLKDFRNVPTDADASAKIGIKYSGNKADAEVKLLFQKDIIKDHPFDIIDELTLSGYMGNLTLNAGKMKIIWGKGDKLHVLDNFNADDYTDFIFPDYLDRRISTPMAQAIYAPAYSNSVVSNIRLEAVYTPFLPTDRFASKGYWVPGQVGELKSTVTGIVSTNLATKLAKKDALISTPPNPPTADYIAAEKDYLEYLTYANSLMDDPENLYPDTNTLKYSQLGGRVTATFRQFDVGASYYYGHYKQPSVDLSSYYADAEAIASNTTFLTNYGALIQGGAISKEDAIKAFAIQSGTELSLPELHYDRKQTFGLEASTILWHFNLRGEAAFNLTEDTKGDNPWVHNNSVAWLAGFDIDLPFANMNVNIQETGSLTLNYDKVKDGAFKEYDADYNAGHATNNRLVANITTSFMNEKLSPEVTVMYGIERGDLVVMPKIVYKPVPDLSLTASGMYLGCKNEESEFHAWENNSFVQLGARVVF